MSRGIPDRVPVIPQICIPHAARMLGMDYESTVLETIRNPALINKYDFLCAKEYGVDGMRAWLVPDPLDVVKIDGVWFGRDPRTGEKLGPVDFEGGGGVVPSEDPTIHQADEIAGKIPVLSAEEILKSGKLDSIKMIIKEGGEDLFVIGAPGCFTVEKITFLRGKAQAMMDLMDDPDFCHKIMERSLAAAIQRSFALAAIGIDALYIGETFGGVISPDQFKEFCFPYFKRFAQAIKGLPALSVAAGLPNQGHGDQGKGPLVYLHICGNSAKILEMMAETGVDCIEPLDPLGGVKIADAKKRVGHRVALMGGVHTVKLAHGTLQEVVDDCRRCLSEGAPGGGYLLAAGDMLPTETSREKVEAMINAAKKYKY